MLNVLKATPGVQSTKLEVSTEHGWNQPMIEYEYSTSSGHKATVVFVAQKVGGGDQIAPSFLAILNGLFDGRTPPSDFGAGRISQVLEKRCGVIATAIFE
jgi:hypothetical protein